MADTAWCSSSSRAGAAFYSSRDESEDGRGMELLRIVTLGYGGEGVFDLCTYLTLTANQLAIPGLRDDEGRVDLGLLLEPARSPG
ncbi:hypothetical protein AB0C52_23980 [Streptomyces sp. NPDC048717]|uniref:hypothetical protein n=1 Tax=Streptomyces sp. NPDC048717 TaxID=3154928 RepID=UPI00341DD64F